MPPLRYAPVTLALTALAAGLAGARGADEIDRARAEADPGGTLLWYDLRLLDLEGQGWADTKAPFDRLPARAEGVVRGPVWELSRHSAGLCARFVTDATALHARWTLTSADLAMPHMPATGVSGLDLYVRSRDRWQWLAVGRPTHQANAAQLVGGLAPGKREFLLYLPLYNGVSSVQIGIPKGSALARGPARPAQRQRPIVFYGTSITQGGCASRPGMVHTAILGRRLERPVINLGFSGNGTMDPELARLLAELDPAAYVVDCLPNMTAGQVADRAEPFIRTLVRARPRTPILLVEDRTYANASELASLRSRHAASRAALKRVYDNLIAERAGDLHYLPGDKLLGDDGEATVDGSHPTDLGFMRQAYAFLAALTPLLPGAGPRAGPGGLPGPPGHPPGERARAPRGPD
jgi:hypothetical protein